MPNGTEPLMIYKKGETVFLLLFFPLSGLKQLSIRKVIVLTKSITLEAFQRIFEEVGKKVTATMTAWITAYGNA